MGLNCTEKEKGKWTRVEKGLVRDFFNVDFLILL